MTINARDLRTMLGEVMDEYEAGIEAMEGELKDLMDQREELDNEISEVRKEAEAMAADRKLMSGDLEHNVRANVKVRKEPDSKPVKKTKRVNDFGDN